MPKIGEQADILRGIGRFLDDETARDIEIKVHETFIGVTWNSLKPGSQYRAYKEHDLETLRRQARKIRRDPYQTPLASWAELLRTLGQDLDAGRIEVTAILQQREILHVSGMIAGLYSNRSYLMAELEERARERRFARGTGKDDPALTDPFVLLTAGLPVSTRDDRNIGTVAAIEGRYFQIAAPLLKFVPHHYWLPADCVQAVARGEHVRLSCQRSELGRYKLSAPPATGNGSSDNPSPRAR
jgi:hypothetical protein